MTVGRTMVVMFGAALAVASTLVGGLTMADDVPVPKLICKATFGGGCFWCTEAVYAQIKGVKSVTSGYIGGEVPNPTYKDVCTGLTGHAEAIEIEYDPEVVPFEKLLEVF